jgi:hypothetical protein
MSARYGGKCVFMAVSTSCTDDGDGCEGGSASQRVSSSREDTGTWMRLCAQGGISLIVIDRDR